MAAAPTIATLYSDHHGSLQGWLRGKLGNASQAANLVHDTYVRLLQSRRADFGAQPRAYLDTIALPPEAQSPSPETRLLVLDPLTGSNTVSGVTVRQGGMSLLDLMASWQASRQLSLQPNVYNVFDKYYYQAVGTTQDNNHFGAPVNVLLSAKYAF